MARERNNIYAIAADAVDLALDTAGTIGSMMGGIVGIVPTKSDAEGRREADDAAGRVSTSLRQEADAAKDVAKPRPHKASARPHKASASRSRTTKSHTTKPVKKTAKRSSARKVVH